MNIGSLPEAIRDAGTRGAALMLAAAFIAHLTFGKSEVQRKQDKLDELVLLTLDTGALQ